VALPLPRIIFNARPLDVRGGVSPYVRELLAAMVKEVSASMTAAVQPPGGRSGVVPAG
jgi:hypothetical protein